MDSELKRLQKLERSVNRENRGVLATRGCILCGAHRKKYHKCGLPTGKGIGTISSISAPRPFSIAPIPKKCAHCHGLFKKVGNCRTAFLAADGHHYCSGPCENKGPTKTIA